MKNLLILFALTLLISCQKDQSEGYHSLPECLQLEIDSPEVEVVKIGTRQETEVDGKTIYWVFYDDQNDFGNQLDSECQPAGCVAWCGMTTRQEIDNIFDLDWTIIWER